MKPNRLAQALLARGASTPVDRLSPMERRLLDIAMPFFSLIAIQLRVGPGGHDELPPLTQDIAVRAASFALACAVEVERPLRDVRDALNLQPRGES